MENGQTKAELLGFTYTQFIYLDDIKAFQEPENLEIVERDNAENKRALSYWEQKALNEKKARKGEDYKKKPKTIKRHLFKTW